MKDTKIQWHPAFVAAMNLVVYRRIEEVVKTLQDCEYGADEIIATIRGKYQVITEKSI